MPREGTFVAVVGASGAGKDSLIAFARNALAKEPGFVFPRRIITRPPEGTEDHISSSVDEFLHMRDSGYFTLHWEAHGLHYGVPRGVELDVADGREVIVNLSRGALGRMRQIFPTSVAIEITASPETLARRLAGRGREPAAEQAVRLRRVINAPADLTIANDGHLEYAGHAFVRALRTITARHAIMLGL
jgi:ribose 1,5-bisphosphokinase